jgi:maleate isomerase
MTGKWRKSPRELQPALAEAAAALSDTKPALIVFHCTANSMEQGIAGDAFLADIVRSASGCEAITTARAITDALDHLSIKKLVLLTPYIRQTNEREVEYLHEAGYEVVHELGLALESDGYMAVTPERWVEIALQNRRTEADGYLLSCTNTRTIEAIDDLERELGKPVVTSNQATLWTCLKKLGIEPTNHKLGRLFNAG